MLRILQRVGTAALILGAIFSVAASASAQTAPPTPGGRIVSGSIPSDGGFGLIVYSGGTFDDLVVASGCPASRVAFWFTVGGQFVVFVPGTTVGAVMLALKPRSRTAPSRGRRH